MPARMRAVRQRSFGGPEVLELAEAYELVESSRTTGKISLTL